MVAWTTRAPTLDVVVLAGDIARPAAAAAWALGFDRPVLYVIGNHEFYGGSLPEVRAEFRRPFEGSHVHLLDNDVLELGGVRFIGSTLWTDFRANGDGLAGRGHAQSGEFM